MISFAQAYQLVLGTTPDPEIEQVDLVSATGRVLAQDVAADTDVPPFDRAAMDGYALQSGDIIRVPVELAVVGEVAAGTVFSSQLESGQAVQIMTGAPVPAGADAVQMIERTEATGSRVRILEPVRSGDRIARRGSEVACGEVVLAKGSYLGAAEVALLALCGAGRVSTFKAPSVAVVATGDELIEPGGQPAPGQIRNSNSYMLAAQLKLRGIEVDNLGLARDRVADLQEKIAAGLEKDLLLLTGGVSAGKYDLVCGVLGELGVQIFFDRVAVKPGKPVTFGRRDRTLVFGLPGNPVSAFVAFETLVVPSIRKRSGFSFFGPHRVSGTLMDSIKKSGDRALFAPANVRYDSGWRIMPLATRGSADIYRFSRADALLYFEKEITSLPAGAGVQAYLLPDYFNRQGCDVGIFSPVSR